MGYCDELIARLQQDGLWDKLTTQQQKGYQTLSDDHARQVMVMTDQFEIGDPQAVQKMALVSFGELIGAFCGALVEHQGEEIGRLSKAGKLLAEFFEQLRLQELSSDDIDAGMQKLDTQVIASLMTLHKNSGQ